MSACRPVPDPQIPRFTIGYNSHGEWTTLAEVRELELERENEFPDLPGCPDDTPAIWVTQTRRDALRYVELASEWDRIDAGGQLTPDEVEHMEGIPEIPILPTDQIVADDGDGGYLVLRPRDPPTKGDMPPKGIPDSEMVGCITTGRRAGYCPPTTGYLPILPPPPPPPEFSDATLDHFLFFAFATDGIVVEPEVANDPDLPCRCVSITKTNGTEENLCFKRGVVGTLSQAQERALCKITEPLSNPAGFQDRVKKFQRASEACVAAGADTFNSRIECMSKYLKDHDPPLLRNARRVVSMHNSGDNKT